ncbi:MAG: hypothetical protein CL681_28285 [Blastopirellula sp.]|nr:hypothetical protein [Blastopirellula sp.]
MRKFFIAFTVLGIVLQAGLARGQSFGVELMNNIMPASGGMAGASIARPQDVQSAIYGNPATMSQYQGTHFAMSGSWIEPTYNLSVGTPPPSGFNVGSFTNAKSDAQGIAAANIGLTQDFSALGMPLTVGMGLMAGAGAGVDFRHVPASNGTHTSLVALDIGTGAALQVTDRLSAGATLSLTSCTMDGPFVDITGSSSDYALRTSVGLNYDLGADTSLGTYWKSQAKYTFENAVAFPLDPTTYFDVKADRPEILGLGIANSTLLDGRLLLALDAVYQMYTESAMFGAIFHDQWALQLGAQYTVSDKIHVRAGYAWNENPMRDLVGSGLGGVLPPGGINHVEYIQALFAAIPQHRITAGVSAKDVLPGVDLDFFAGGMFEATETFGVTTASLKGYWLGTGLTWHFGRGAAECGSWK